MTDDNHLPAAADISPVPLTMNSAAVCIERMPDPSPSLLLAFRRRHLLTQEEAAALVAMGSSSWRQIETGFRGRRPTASLLAHLAALDALAANEIEWPKPRGTDLR